MKLLPTTQRLAAVAGRRNLPPLLACQCPWPPSSKYHESVMFTLGRLSVFLHSFGQQVVQTGNHWPGVVVQAGCDHGVVVDLREARIQTTTVTTALTHDKQRVAFSDTNDCESPIQKGITRICTDILHIF